MATGIIGRKSNAHGNLTRLSLFDIDTNLQYNKLFTIQLFCFQIVRLNVYSNEMSYYIVVASKLLLRSCS